jgi:hypothetical protein
MAEETEKPAPAKAAAPTAKAAAAPEAEKAEAAPLERRTSQDFEIGGDEEMFLPGGSTADLAQRQWEEMVDKLRSEQPGQL